MFQKLKLFVTNLLFALKKLVNSNNDVLPTPDPNNATAGFFVEQAINHFRLRNHLLKYGLSVKLKEIACKHSAEMCKKNKIISTLNGFSLQFGLLKEGIKATNQYMIVVQSFTDTESIVRKILSTTIYRNMLLSDSYVFMGVSVYNGFCTVLLTSKF